jgi:hypothetical protein
MSTRRGQRDPRRPDEAYSRCVPIPETTTRVQGNSVYQVAFRLQQGASGEDQPPVLVQITLVLHRRPIRWTSTRSRHSARLSGPLATHGIRRDGRLTAPAPPPTTPRTLSASSSECRREIRSPSRTGFEPAQSRKSLTFCSYSSRSISQQAAPASHRDHYPSFDSFAPSAVGAAPESSCTSRRDPSPLGRSLVQEFVVKLDRRRRVLGHRGMPGKQQPDGEGNRG